MTEKRFNYEYRDDKFYDKGFFLDNGKRMFKDEVLNTLNELHEENQELKRIIKKMSELGGFNKHMIKTICGDVE